MERKDNTSRNSIIFTIILIIIFTIVYSKIFNENLSIGGDNYGYLLLSKNIINGHGYSDLIYDGTYKPTGWFPPGYPYILAITKLIIGNNVIGLKILNGILFLSSIILFFLLIRKIIKDDVFAFAISILLLLNSGLLRLSTIIMSEIPFLFFTTLAMYSIVKFDQNEEDKFWKSKYFYLAVTSSVISFYTRGFGIVLIISTALHWLLKRKWKLSCAFIIGNIILYLPYFIRNKIYGIKGRYLKMVLIDNPWRPESGSIGTFSQFWSKITTNLNDTIIHGFPEVMFPAINVSEPTLILKIFGIVIILLSFLGIWHIKKYRYMFGVYLILNMGIFLLWHTGNGVRYVWPLAGFILLTSFYGIYVILTKYFHLKKTMYIGISFLLLSFFSFSEINKLESEAKAKIHPAYKNYILIAKEIEKQPNSENYLVICRKPSIFAYYSNTRTAQYVNSLDDNKVIQKMIDIGADFVVLEQLGYSSTPRYLFPAIQKNPHLFKMIMHLKEPDTYLLKFDKEKAKEERQK